MKQLTAITLSLLLLVGCTTSQQSTSFKTISSLETTTTAAYTSYVDLVLQNKLPADDNFRKASRLFNDFQAATMLAVTATQNGANAVAPSALVQESADIIALVTQLKGGK